MSHPATDKNIPEFVGEAGIDRYLAQRKFCVLDFETTNKTSGAAVDPDNDIVLACWYVVEDGHITQKHKFGDEYEMGELLSDINDSDFLVAQNVQFELQWLSRCGLDLRSVLVYDTMLGEWVLQGNRKVPYNLDAMAKRYGVGAKESLVSKLIKSQVCPSLIPRSWLLEYCFKDVEVTYKVMLKQFEQISNHDLWHLVLQRNLVAPALADIGMQGLELDKEKVYEEEKRLQHVIEELGQQLDEITGGINLGSPKQLGDFLYDRIGFAPPLDNAGEVITTGTGGVSTAVPALAKLVATTPEQERFLELYKEYNNASTLLTKNVGFFKDICDQRGAKFFGQLRQCQTANHRLASTGIKVMLRAADKITKKGRKEVWVAKGVQVQNLPRQYKPMFTSHDPDYVVSEYDGSQIEFRVAAELGNDSQAEADIVNGVDIHSFTRDTINKAYEDNNIKLKVDRQGAKAHTFAPLYGAMGKDVAEQGYAQAFREKYNGVYSTQQDWTLIVADQKKLTTPYGLTFHWPSAKMHRSGYVSFSTEIFNLPISGFATGEIIPIALVHFWHRIKDTRARIFNTVHDSIIVYNHKEEVDYVTEIAKQSMGQDVYKFLREVYRYDFRVPLGFGAKTGTHWGASNVEMKWDLWPDGNERLQVEENKEIRVVYDTREQEVN